MMNVAMMGPALHATFMDVDRTLHHVPNSVGENHCKIWRQGSRPIHTERKRKLKLSLMFVVYYRPRSLGQGNVFTHVCHSVPGGRV